MLKKLVKYGNSNAIILDRAIMELLNMQEGGTVKLQTDGKSLIITPVELEKPSNITLDGLETLINISAEKQAELKADPEKKRLKDEWAPGTENFKRLMEVSGPITSKYMKEMQAVHSPAFMAEVDVLAAKYHGDKSSEGFMKEYNEFFHKQLPHFKQMQEELKEVYKEVGYPTELMQDWK